jgi:hypothetical protein
MLVPEKEADGIFLGHIPAEQFHRRLQVGVRESLDEEPGADTGRPHSL